MSTLATLTNLHSCMVMKKSLLKQNGLVINNIRRHGGGKKDKYVYDNISQTAQLTKEKE